MSTMLWDELPNGLLKKQFKAFNKLDSAVKRLIIDLAKRQKFKCAFSSCNKNTGLEIDHDPAERLPYTIFNVRGLVCHRCNLALRAHEMEERGEISSWEGGHPCLSDFEIEDYRYAFECRAAPLIDAAHVAQVGCRNTGHREFILRILDTRHKEGRFPWQCRSEEKRNGEIRSPEQFIKVLAACMEFVVQQLKKDKSYQPPELFF